MKVGIFDLDGTIADSMQLWGNIGALYLKEKGLETPRDLDESLKELSLEEGIRYIKDETGLVATVDQIKMEIKDLLRSYYKEIIKAKPFAMELLESLKNNGTRLILATASDESLANEFLQRYGVNQYFESIYTPEKVGYSKSQAEFFEVIMRNLDLEAKDVWVFEDAYHAILSAKKCGLKVVAIEDESALKEADAIRQISDIYVENFKELKSYHLWNDQSDCF